MVERGKKKKKKKRKMVAKKASVTCMESFLNFQGVYRMAISHVSYKYGGG